uniref:Uncharacterized protein n=1 Tax=Arundo donax TaxID=35708 RepID=A0A0A9E1S9_ARUDO
MGPRSPTNQLS